MDLKKALQRLRTELAHESLTNDVIGLMRITQLHKYAFIGLMDLTYNKSRVFIMCYEFISNYDT
jgi:NhaP-type Na+/H+ or K+/H+ antiporter